MCWGLTSQSTIFQSYRDGAIASWVINQYFRGVKCLAQGHNTAAVGLEPRTSRSGVRHSTTEPPRSPRYKGTALYYSWQLNHQSAKVHSLLCLLPWNYCWCYKTFNRNFSMTDRGKNIRIFHECEVRIEKSVRGSLFGITRLCRVRPNSDPEGRIFLSAPNNHDRFFFLHTFWSPAFEFNVGSAINESPSYTLTSAILKVDVIMTSTPNGSTVTWPPIQPMYWQHVLLFVFIYPMCRISVCKIRSVRTGENCGKPCLVCKKMPFDLPEMCKTTLVPYINIIFNSFDIYCYAKFIMSVWHYFKLIVATSRIERKQPNISFLTANLENLA